MAGHGAGAAVVGHWAGATVAGTSGRCHHSGTLWGTLQWGHPITVATWQGDTGTQWREAGMRWGLWGRSGMQWEDGGMRWDASGSCGDGMWRVGLSRAPCRA